jgi:hypothetical protein
MLQGDPGHPILFAWAVGVLYRVFGVTNALPHLATWVLSALLLTKVFELGEHAGAALGAKAARATGVVAALLLFFHPMFISRRRLPLEMPNAAFAGPRRSRRPREDPCGDRLLSLPSPLRSAASGTTVFAGIPFSSA